MRDNIDRDFWEAISRFDDRYKPKVIGISLSSSFMARARCRFCTKPPSAYYACFKPNLWGDASTYRKFTPRSTRWIRRMTSSWYKEYPPKEFTDIYEFTFRMDFKSYRPLLFRSVGNEISGRDNVIDCVSCECGRTVWAFNQTSTQKRLEVISRKGKYAYPQRFVK